MYASITLIELINCPPLQDVKATSFLSLYQLLTTEDRHCTLPD